MKYNKVRDLIRKYVEQWVSVTGLAYWHIDILYSSETKEARIGNGNNVAGYCECEWQYQKATITFYPKAMKSLKAEDIERVVVHELMHIFLNEMREDDINHEERCATQLQKAFIWVRDHAKDI